VATKRNFGITTLRFNQGIIVSGTDCGNGTVIVTGSMVVSGAESSPALDLYTSLSGKYAAVIDNDQNSQGHGLKVTSDGSGTGTNLFDVESGITTVFRVRGDGKVAIGETSEGGIPTQVEALTVNGDLSFRDYLKRRGDGDTYIGMPANDQMELVAGGVTFVSIVEDGSQDKITFNDNAADVDFIVESPNETKALYLHAGNEVFHINHGESNFQTKIHNTNDLALTVNSAGVVLNDDGHATNDFRVESDNNNHMLFVDAGNDSISIASNTVSGTDTNFLVSGSISSRGTTARGTSVFGGDLFSSGTFYSMYGMRVDTSAEIHVLNIDPTLDTVSFFKEGTPGSDVNWFVSGAIGGTINHAAFGGDLVVSGNLGIGTGSPAEILHIVGADSVLRLDDTTSNYRIDLEVGGGLKLMMGTTTNSDAFMTLMAHSGKNKLDTTNRDFHLYGNNTTTGFYFDESEGTFGFGTDSPTATVQIVGTDTDNLLSLRSDSYVDLLVVTGSGRVGINAPNPGSTLQVSGSVGFLVSSFASNHALDETHTVAIADCNGGNVTLTLPPAADAIVGRKYIIKRLDSGGSGGGNSLTIARNGAVIDGAASNIGSIENQTSHTLICLGAGNGWAIIDKYVGI